MIYFNLTRLLKLRGVERPYSWLVANGFVPQTATRWAKNQIGHIRADHMERLCLLLNCTPNDLFEWREDTNTHLADGHALRTLKRDPSAKSFTEMTRDIPADKMEKLSEMLAELKSDVKQ